jgi:HPt (histidine-containing phosphotransfer) domain-containing protein
MTSQELLRFFHAESREYLDAIDGFLAGGSFEAGGFVAASRALRGSATMARVPRIPEIALVLERIANGVRDGEVHWSPTVRRDLTEAVEDLRSFVGAATRWTSEDDRRATKRLASLRAHLPAGASTPPATTAGAGTTPVFIALQASAIAADVESFLDNPTHRRIVDDVVNRVRSLRGIAGVTDYPPLGDVSDAVEKALRELAPDAFLREVDVELLRSAAAVFRRASLDLRGKGLFNRTTPEVDRFARAAVAAETTADHDVPVVRIEELFYTDAGPHLVQRGAAPSRSAEARFRDEVVARAEHLRRLVAEGRVAMDPFTRERVRRDLKAHLTRMDDFARSYGAQQVASVMSEVAALESFDDPAVLDTIEAVARTLTTPGISTDDMERRLAVRERVRHETPPAPVRAATPPHVPPARSSGAHSGAMLHALIGTSLSTLASLDENLLAEPSRVDEDVVVPVDSILYRGTAALARAREVRDVLRAHGGVDEQALNELYDLLDLARTE